jgi:plasmid maintenance system antidote protein VapI
LAIRLAKAFGATRDIWIRMQAAYDLAQARQHEGNIMSSAMDRRRRTAMRK